MLHIDPELTEWYDLALELLHSGEASSLGVASALAQQLQPDLASYAQEWDTRAVSARDAARSASEPAPERPQAARAR